MKKRVLIVAGEASGDMHAAGLVRAVKRQAPDVEFAGIGGRLMREAGVDILVDSAQMAVVGLFEVLAHFPTIYGALQLMRRQLRETKPDLLILVDYPDFNLRLAKTAKELGIKVLYYISPQVWAWRQERVHMIGQRIDMMAVVFPFEVPFYESANVPVRFVGHPLLDEIGTPKPREQAVADLGLDPTRKIFGLFPGSRRSEIKRLLPTLLESARLLKTTQPDLQLVLPLASTLNETFLAPFMQGYGELGIQVIQNRFYDVTCACDAVVTASGTATLEIALLGTPLAVIYKIAPLSYRIMSRMIKVPHIALCNIVAEERIAPELIQHDATPDRIVEVAQRMLNDAEYATSMRARLATIRSKLGDGGAAGRVGQLALELLQ